MSSQISFQSRKRTMKVIILLFVAFIAALSAVDGKIRLKPEHKPFPGLRRGTKEEVIPKIKQRTIEGRIIDGQYASNEQLPYHVGVMVGFGTNVYAWCGGTLIGNEWIITAAHCTSGAQSIEVRLGSVDSDHPLRISWGYQNHIHPDYGTQNGDIALVKIQWVDYNVNMAPAALPPLNGPHSSYVDARVVASGWGAINDNGESTNQLKYVAMTVMNGDECASYYGTTGNDPSILCTRTSGFGGTCSGDSGGPLVIENTRLLIGVTTFVSAAGCTVGHPDGFSRVTYYLSWIKDISGISW